MKVYSSTERNNVFVLPTIDYEAADMDERNKKVQELLPKFVQEFNPTWLFISESARRVWHRPDQWYTTYFSLMACVSEVLVAS